jgi:hypothetical protein
MKSWGIFSYSEMLHFVSKVTVLCALFFAPGFLLVHAGTIHEYRDTISSSAPNAYANHTIEFKTTVAIPAGGYVRFTPDSGDFTIPSSNLDHENVELAVSTAGSYVTRAATTTATGVEDGVSITTGSSGNIEATLNSSTGIPADAYIRMRIGDHTTNGTTTDVGILNPPTTGTFNYLIETGSGSLLGSATGLVAIVNSVSVGPIDTREYDPPVRFNGAPSGTISGTTEYVEMSLETDEFARCRYSTATDTPYFSMTNEFTTTFKTVHPVVLQVATNTEYRFFVRCIDDEGNVNTDDYVISFFVPEFPEGSPGGSGEEEGEGSGTGEGSGDSDDGDGSPTGGDAASGGTSGGGSGGGGGGGSGSSSGGDDGSGGFEGVGKAYQSGDGLVIINGYAFPRSTVSILVDGTVADTVTADGSGEFTVELDEIARGVYTFGVYAVDRQGVRSSTFSTTFSVTGARGSTLSNVNVMPSIKVTPNPVTAGQQLTLTGYAIPNALITLENQLDKSSVTLKTYTTNSDSNGAWSITIDSTGFKNGTYKTRAKAEQTSGDLVKTNFSGYTFYGVGQAAEGPRTSDLNRDGKVNLIDFSILLFWWNSDGGNSNPPADINADGKVSLTDFSILIFNWTG